MCKNLLHGPLRYYFLTIWKLLLLQTDALVLALLCYNSFIPVTAKQHQRSLTRTPKTTPLMGLFLSSSWKQGSQEEDALILAVFSGINGWVTETRVGFSRLRVNDINKLVKQAATPLIASKCKKVISAGSVSLSNAILKSKKSKTECKNFNVRWWLNAEREKYI